MATVFDNLQTRIRAIAPVARLGRVARIERGVVEVTGLADAAALGDRVAIAPDLMAEVVALSDGRIAVLPDAPPDGIALGQSARLVGPLRIAPDRGWIGRVIDPDGMPLDGRPLLSGAVPRPIRANPPPAARRGRMGERLATGTAVFDTLLPLVRGQRIGLFAGSGVGKSSLLAQLARGVAADVVVVALVGERGRELRAFCEDVLGADGMARSVVVAATSDQSPLMRHRCALTAMTVAEYFRDQGLHVLYLCDSITRFAEAHREVAVAGGEAAALRGYPPSLSHAIMSLAERAGPGPVGAGDITAVLSVLVAGSDMEEPVADILRGTIDGHVVLSREIAERGRYPAVDLLRSVSRSLPHAATDAENRIIAEVRRLLGAYDRAELMVQSGLYVAGSDALTDRAIKLYPALDAFIAEPADSVDAAFARLAMLLGVPAP